MLEQSSGGRAARLRALADRIPSADEPLRASVWAGLGLGLLLFALASCEAAATSGRAAEQAVVVAVSDSDNGRPCDGRGGQRTDVTWRSSDPPGGLPAEFVHVGACGDWFPGDEATLVRVPAGNAVDVYVEPIRSYSLAGRIAAAAALGVCVLGTVLLSIRLAAVRLWARLRRRRQRRGGGS